MFTLKFKRTASVTFLPGCITNPWCLISHWCTSPRWNFMFQTHSLQLWKTAAKYHIQVSWVNTCVLAERYRPKLSLREQTSHERGGREKNPHSLRWAVCLMLSSIQYNAHLLVSPAVLPSLVLVLKWHFFGCDKPFLLSLGFLFILIDQVTICRILDCQVNYWCCLKPC